MKNNYLVYNQLCEEVKDIYLSNRSQILKDILMCEKIPPFALTKFNTKEELIIAYQGYVSRNFVRLIELDPRFFPCDGNSFHSRFLNGVLPFWDWRPTHSFEYLSPQQDPLWFQLPRQYKGLVDEGYVLFEEPNTMSGCFMLNAASLEVYEIHKSNFLTDRAKRSLSDKFTHSIHISGTDDTEYVGLVPETDLQDLLSFLQSGRLKSCQSVVEAFNAFSTELFCY